jgi:hypothetical protein
MNAKIVAALVAIAAITGLGKTVRAQSQTDPSSKGEQYTLSGDSLTGINNRTAENDFARFFIQSQNITSPIVNNIGENVDSYLGVWQISDQIQLQRVNNPRSPSIQPIIFQPAQSVDGNDGLQFQLDVRQ